MKLKNLIKSRRGMAIEMAIGVMLLMMAFTITLLSTAGLQNDHRVDDYNDFNKMVEIDSVGMAVLAGENLTLDRVGETQEFRGQIAMNKDTLNEKTYNVRRVPTKYGDDNNLDGTKYEITEIDNEYNILLTIIVDGADGKTIISWK